MTPERWECVQRTFSAAIEIESSSRVASEQTCLLWSIRFGVVCPLGLVVLCYSYVSSFERHWQLLVATLVLSATAGFIIMITAMPAPAMLRHRRFSRINSYPSPWRRSLVAPSLPNHSGGRQLRNLGRLLALPTSPASLSPFFLAFRM